MTLTRDEILAMTPDQLRVEIAKTHPRFIKFVSIDEVDSCWNWKGATVGFGYGHYWNGTKNVRAHRFVYEFAFGKIEDGLCICHKCDNPKCVNPLHLFAGTQSDNMKDCYAKKRDGLFLYVQYQKSKQYCNNGHEYTDDNSFIRPNGYRECRICMKEQRRRRNAKRMSKRAEVLA